MKLPWNQAKALDWSKAERMDFPNLKPTIMSKYEQLRKLVYSHIYPDGIPLEFGCEVETSGFTNWVMVSKDQAVKQDILGKEMYLGYPTHGKHKILGRPLELRDVLLAVEEEFNLSIQSDELTFYPLHPETPNKEEWFDFDLTKPISEQDDEVLEKLIELIK